MSEPIYIPKWHSSFSLMTPKHNLSILFDKRALLFVLSNLAFEIVIASNCDQACSLSRIRMDRSAKIIGPIRMHLSYNGKAFVGKAIK